MESNFARLELPVLGSLIAKSQWPEQMNVNLPETLRMGSITLPDFLEQPTGFFHLDVLPVVTLLVTAPTFMIYWKNRRYYDVFAAGVSVWLALLFHLCHMHIEGIQAVKYLGIDGVTWRTLDILAAQILLARTFAHIVGNDHPAVAAVPNVLLPVVHFASLFLHENLEMRYVVGVTLTSLALTLTLKLLLEGWDAFPSYTGGVGLRITSSVVAAFACFVAPHLQPDRYWLWHSLWHVFLGVGYYELYSHLTSSAAISRSSSKPKLA